VTRKSSRGRFILGEEVSVFEKEFAAYCGSDMPWQWGQGRMPFALAMRLLASGKGTGLSPVAHSCRLHSGDFVHGRQAILSGYRSRNIHNGPGGSGRLLKSEPVKEEGESNSSHPPLWSSGGIE
jgi:hypothetical protein